MRTRPMMIRPAAGGGGGLPLAGYDALFFSHLDTFSDTGLTTPESTNGNTVAGWKNQAAGATKHLLQDTTGPKVSTATVLNGYRTLRFEGGRRLLGQLLHQGATEHTALLVVKIDNDSGAFNGLWSQGGGSAGAMYSEFGTVKDNSFANNRVGSGWSSGGALTNWHVYGVRAKSADWSSYLDTTQKVSTASFTLVNPNDLYLGNNASGDALNGYIAGCFVRHAWRNDTDIVADIGELMTFYGL